MSVISSTIMAELERLLVQAYDNIESKQGDVNTVNSIARDVSKIKSVIRGGGDTLSGIRPIGGVYGGVATHLTNGSIGLRIGAVSVNTPYFNNAGEAGLYTIPTTDVVIGYDDANGVVPSTNFILKSGSEIFQGGYVGNRIFISIPVPGANPTYFVKKSRLSLSNYNTSSDTPATPSYYTPICPTYNKYETPIAEAIVTYPGLAIKNTATIKVLTDVREKGYYEAPNDDTVVTDLFGIADTLDAQELTKTRYSELSTVVNSIKSHTHSRTGIDFYAYWTSQGYTFSNKFRELYNKVTYADFPQLKVSFNGVSVATESRYGGFPSISDSAIQTPMSYAMHFIYPIATPARSTVVIDGVTPSYTELTTYVPYLRANSVYINVKDPSVIGGSVATPAKVALQLASGRWGTLDVYNATYNALKLTSAPDAVFSGTPGTNTPMFAPGTRIYSIATTSIGIPTGVSNATYTVNNNTKYIAIADAALSGLSNPSTSLKFYTI